MPLYATRDTRFGSKAEGFCDSISCKRYHFSTCEMRLHRVRRGSNGGKSRGIVLYVESSMVQSEVITMIDTLYYQDLIKAMQVWMDSENQTIKDAEYMKKEADNPFVKMAMEMLIHDAEKHRLIQQIVIDSLMKEAVHLTPDESAPLKEVLNRHIAEASESLMRVVSILDKRERRITRYLLSYLGADEAGHRELVGKLNELKLATIQMS